MTIPTKVLGAMVTWPAFLASGLLSTTVLAVMPLWVGTTLAAATIAALLTLASGRLQQPTIRLLLNSRPATGGEQQVLAPIWVRLSGIGAGSLDLQVRRWQRQSTPPVLVLGRSIAVTPALIEAVHRRWVSVDEVMSLAVHGLGARGGSRPPREVAFIVATLPSRALSFSLGRAAASFRCLPFVRTAWMLRGAMVPICVAQAFPAGRPAAGLLGAGVICLTYLVPAADRSLRARREAAGDQLVKEHALGSALVAVCDFFGRPVPLERCLRLQRPPSSGQRTGCRFVHDQQCVRPRTDLQASGRSQMLLSTSPARSSAS